jgi:hypothetical protein
LLVIRALLPIALMAAQGAVAQEPAPAASRCNVVSGSVEVDDQGRFVRPPPTPDECLFVADLVGKLERSEPSKLRRTTNVRRIPDPLLAQIAPDVNSRQLAIWISDQLVVIAYRSEDFSGPATNVLVADLEMGTVCRYPRWPTDDAPYELTLREIQEVLDSSRSGRPGTRAVPPCYLSEFGSD